LYVNISDARLDDLRREHPGLAQATIDAALRALGHEFNLLGSGPYIPDDPERPPDATGYRPIDWFWTRCQVCASTRCAARRLELRRDAARPLGYPAAVGAGAMSALGDRRRGMRWPVISSLSGSRASCAIS
jgi:hypothetical protein